MSDEPWLILPTYNEAENIEAIVAASGEALRGAAPEGWRVLIVDDGSPDGTGEIVDRLAGEHDWVKVLHRAEKSGIGCMSNVGVTLGCSLCAPRQAPRPFW